MNHTALICRIGRRYRTFGRPGRTGERVLRRVARNGDLKAPAIPLNTYVLAEDIRIADDIIEFEEVDGAERAHPTMMFVKRVCVTGRPRSSYIRGTGRTTQSSYARSRPETTGVPRHWRLSRARSFHRVRGVPCDARAHIEAYLLRPSTGAGAERSLARVATRPGAPRWESRENGVVTSDRAVNDATLRAYEMAADVYAAKSLAVVNGVLAALLDAFIELVWPAATVLELGSGTGRDADALEQRGARVVRTDAASSFVDRLRERGHDAALVNVLTDELGGPYDGIFANAVLLHVPREDMSAVLDRMFRAVAAGGALGFTLKVGEGDAWSDEKLGLPRFFAYWTAADVRRLIDSSPWQLVVLDEVSTGPTKWLHVLCRRP